MLIESDPRFIDVEVVAVPLLSIARVLPNVSGAIIATHCDRSMLKELREKESTAESCSRGLGLAVAEEVRWLRKGNLQIEMKKNLLTHQ